MKIQAALPYICMNNVKISLASAAMEMAMIRMQTVRNVANNGVFAPRVIVLYKLIHTYAIFLYRLRTELLLLMSCTKISFTHSINSYKIEHPRAITFKTFFGLQNTLYAIEKERKEKW